MLKANAVWTHYLSELQHHKTTSLQTSNKNYKKSCRVHLRSLQLIRQVITPYKTTERITSNKYPEVCDLVLFYLMIWHALIYSLWLLMRHVTNIYLHVWMDSLIYYSFVEEIGPLRSLDIRDPSGLKY